MKNVPKHFPRATSFTAFLLAATLILSGCGGGGGSSGSGPSQGAGGGGSGGDSGPNCSPCSSTSIDAFNGLLASTVWGGTPVPIGAIGLPTILGTITTKATLPNGVNFGPGGGDEIKALTSFIPNAPYPAAKGSELGFTSFVISPNRVTFEDPTDPNAKFLLYAQYQVQLGPDFYGLKLGDLVYCSFYVGSTLAGVGSNVVTNRNAFDGSIVSTAFSCDDSQNGPSNDGAPFSVTNLDPTTPYTFVFSK